MTPLQACPMMGGQSSRSQPGEKLRRSWLRILPMRECLSCASSTSRSILAKRSVSWSLSGRIRLASRRHPWFRSFGLHAVHRDDRRDETRNCPMLAGKGKRAAAPLLLRDAADLVI